MSRLTIAAIAVLTTSCAHVTTTPVERALLDCATPVVQAELLGPDGLAAQAAAILTGGQADWQSALDVLFAHAGPTLICAVQVAVAQLETSPHAQASAGSASVGPLIGAVRGEAWLAAGGRSGMVRLAAQTAK